MKLHDKYTSFFLKTIFKIPYVISIISYFRFLYFKNIKKNFRLLHSQSHKKDGLAFNEKETALESNLYHINKKLNLFEKLKKFSGSRTLLCLSTLDALDFINKKKSKVLSIGPRLEGEIFQIISKGYELENISAIDLQTYSPLIDLGDMANMEYADNSFDVIICSFVLNYSNNIQKSADEIIRVSKNGSLVSIGLSIKPDIQLSKSDLTTSDKVLDYFQGNILRKIYSFHPLDCENNFNFKLSKSFRCFLTFQVSK